MRLAVFILLVTVSCCMGHRGKHRGRSCSRSKSYRPIFRPPFFPRPPISTMGPRTTTKAPPASRPISLEDDFLAAEIGLRIPPKECCISYDEFVEFVVEMDWITIYGIDNDFPVNPQMSIKWQARWLITNETYIRRLGSYWDDLNSTCGFADAAFRRVDETKAIFGAIGATGSDPFITSTRIDYFVSFDIRKYLIQYVCYDDVFKDRCRNSEIAIHVKEQRPGPPNSDGIISGDICLDDIPWGLVETTFRNCLGMQFMDRTEPQIEWYWTDDDGNDLNSVTRLFEEISNTAVFIYSDYGRTY